MTSITLAEIQYDIARLRDGRKKQVLLDTADDIFREFSEQILLVDAAAAESYTVLASTREQAEADSRVRRAYRGRLPVLRRGAGDSQPA